MNIESIAGVHGHEVAKPLAVTVKRACEITGLGNTTIYELIKQGRIRTSKIGRRTLVVYSSLESLVA